MSGNKLKKKTLIEQTEQVMYFKSTSKSSHHLWLYFKGCGSCALQGLGPDPKPIGNE